MFDFVSSPRGPSFAVLPGEVIKLTCRRPCAQGGRSRPPAHVTHQPLVGYASKGSGFQQRNGSNGAGERPHSVAIVRRGEARASHTANLVSIPSAAVAAMILGTTVAFWARPVGTAGGVEDREMTLLWARLKSWWQTRAARAAYRRRRAFESRSRSMPASRNTSQPIFESVSAETQPVWTAPDPNFGY